VVICDYKIKHLACYFRESQSKWFGKSGTSAIGFMIITNPTDEEGKNDGQKDVSFVILFTDDTYQDEWGVATAKLYLYKNCLPSHIDTIYFVSDGAGYSKAKLHKAIMPFWKIWTGITERKNRVTPAGDGKTALGGMFGQLMFLLKGAVDEHAISYYNSSSLMDAVEATRGIKATSFQKYLLDRSNQFKADIRVDERLDSVLLTVLDEDERHVRLFKHSRHGQGIEVSLQDQVDFYWDSARSSKCVLENKKMKPTDNQTKPANNKKKAPKSADEPMNPTDNQTKPANNKKKAPKSADEPMNPTDNQTKPANNKKKAPKLVDEPMNPTDNQTKPANNKKKAPKLVDEPMNPTDNQTKRISPMLRTSHKQKRINRTGSEMSMVLM
jgi:hypothetical protein